MNIDTIITGMSTCIVGMTVVFLVLGLLYFMLLALPMLVGGEKK